MADRFGAWVSRHWIGIILGWLVLVGVVRTMAPRWDDVTQDGDLAYLPADMPSARGEQLLEEAFRDGRAKSELVVVLARGQGPLGPEDLEAADRVASRLINLLAVSAYDRAERLRRDAAQADGPQAQTLQEQAGEQVKRAETLWGEALQLDPRSPLVMHNRGILLRAQGEVDDGNREQQLAWELDPSLQARRDQLVPDPAGLEPLLDVWTRRTDVVGEKLVSDDQAALMTVVRVATEFMALENVTLVSKIEDQLEALRGGLPAGLQMGITGSTAVGADMARSAAESIANTELFTVILVVLILAVVYRSPLLVVVPLLTIGVSLVVAMGLVATLANPDLGVLDFKIFTTTRIFVFVILFGAGTDFCLFLIARYKEELRRGGTPRLAAGRALARVSDALIGSAMTTILGLATMYFAEFGKFSNSGPAIGLCLLVTLIACLTLAPALLRGLGRSVFWPFDRHLPAVRSGAGRSGAPQTGRHSRFWDRMAEWILGRPGTILVVAFGLMLPFAVIGTRVAVTYDLMSELEPSRPSKVGTALMRQHFPIGESGPIVVLMHKPKADLETTAGKRAIFELTGQLYVPGIEGVRSLAEPLGEPPQRTSIFSRKLFLRPHALTRSLYLGRQDQAEGEVARFDLILQSDPFSLAAVRTLDQVNQLLEQIVSSPDSYWAGSTYAFAGTTAAIRDLRIVTRSDNLRIQILVVLAVLAVLLAILRRPVVCFYMILSVLFSYYVTMGATELFFRWAYGDTFQGIDWKVPLFLFVILVAIGQDYNIYLATRVFQEQKAHGTLGGLRRAIERTGGIITSCGVIMAGTFISMTTGSLRTIVELGFALTLGVLIDTFVVRTVLLPAFLAVLFRRWAGSSGDEDRSVPAPHRHTVSVKP